MWWVTASRSREHKQCLKGKKLLFYHLTNIHEIPALTAKVLLGQLGNSFQMFTSPESTTQRGAGYFTTPSSSESPRTCQSDISEMIICGSDLSNKGNKGPVVCEQLTGPLEGD